MTPTQEQIDNLHPELKKIYDAINTPNAKSFKIRIRHMSKILKWADVNSTLFGVMNYETMEYEGYDNTPINFTVKTPSNACWIEALVGTSVKAPVFLTPSVTAALDQVATITGDDLNIAFFKLQELMMERADTIAAALLS